MSLYLRFGVGPLRYSQRLTGGKRRRTAAQRKRDAETTALLFKVVFRLAVLVLAADLFILAMMIEMMGLVWLLPFRQGRVTAARALAWVRPSVSGFWAWFKS